MTAPTDEEYRERARRLSLMLRLRPERHYQATWGLMRPENVFDYMRDAIATA